MNVVIATDVRFWRREYGSHERIFMILNYIRRKGCTVTVYFLGQLPEHDKKIIESEFEYIDFVNPRVSWESGPPSFRIYTFVKGAIRILIEKIKKIPQFIKFFPVSTPPRRDGTANGAPQESLERSLDSFVPKWIQYHFAEFCAERRPEMIIIEYIRMYKLISFLRNYCSHSFVTLVDTHDVMHERRARFHGAGESHEIAVDRDQEQRAIALFDFVMAIQDRDAEKFAQMVPRDRVITVGHAPGLVAPVNDGAQSPVHILFVGSKSAPNVRALEGFLTNVWPAVRRAVSHAVTFDVAGGVCDGIGNRDGHEGVVFHGFVQDIESLYKTSSIIVNPVEFGGGLKIKNVEALCNARPLVTTMVGAEGLEAGIGTAFLVARNNEEMIGQITELVASPERRVELAKRAHEFSRDRLTDDTVFRELDRVMKGVANSAGLKSPFEKSS